MAAFLKWEQHPVRDENFRSRSSTLCAMASEVGAAPCARSLGVHPVLFAHRVLLLQIQNRLPQIQNRLPQIQNRLLQIQNRRPPIQYLRLHQQALLMQAIH